jgi:serine/threonine protein kinase
VENGSLGQTIKAFGKLNERLVATYITKILEGLHYLHTSHVVHCDLKAANILTTKTGNVKLSDFGVSLNLHAKALDEIKNDVAGTPNWSKLTSITTNCRTNLVKLSQWHPRLFNYRDLHQRPISGLLDVQRSNCLQAIRRTMKSIMVCQVRVFALSVVVK